MYNPEENRIKLAPLITPTGDLQHTRTRGLFADIISKHSGLIWVQLEEETWHFVIHLAFRASSVTFLTAPSLFLIIRRKEFFPNSSSVTV